VRFRRALSLAINRYELNRVIYFGLAIEGQNTMLPGSPLYDAERRQRWSGFDLDQANALLDEVGLTQRDRRGARLMPDGRPLEIIVETAGGTEEADVLSLISDSWAQIGVRMFIRPLSLDVMRNRIYGGRTVMSIGSGLENGLATPDIVPSEIAPVDQAQYQWAKWGQYFQTRGESGEPVDLPAAQDLLGLYKAWFAADTEAARARAWQAMLDIHADQVFSIGLVAGVYQPIVVTDGLANVPQEGIWNWNPGAHFGLFGMDRFYFTDPDRRAPAPMPGQSG
jgi:peptide/nickel transport system substrate-binding protein